MRLSRHVVLAAGLCIAGVSVLHAADNNPVGSYDFAPTAAEGSARTVGLGGATLADPRDYSATFVNPAALGGLAGDGIDFGSDSNQVDNFVVDPTQPGAKSLSDPLKFSFYGVRFVSSDGWGYGVAAQRPYQVDDLFSGTAKVRKKSGGFITGQDQTEIQARSDIYSLGAARSFLDKKLSVGLTINYIQVTETYDFNPVFNSTAPIHQKAVSDALSADVGVLAQPWSWLKVAGVYKMSYHTPFDPTRNDAALSTSGKVTAFRDGQAPDRLSLGVALMPNNAWHLFLQGNYTFPLNNAFIIGSNLFPSVTNTLSVQKSASLSGGWGLEFIPIDEPDLTFKLWAGGYLEDTGVQGGFQRYHRTAGFGLSPWFLSLNMAIDDTNLYNNFSVGLGVDILQVASRTARMWGYKLPL